MLFFGHRFLLSYTIQGVAMKFSDTCADVFTAVKSHGSLLKVVQ